MKRYWKLAVLVPLIILCIGTYYAHASGSHNPQYYLKSQTGSEKEASVVSLQGRYMREQVFIRSEGSEYLNEQSFWKSLEPINYYNKEFETLKKEYRQFMRGKTNMNHFYEDDRLIGYANIESQYTARQGQSDFRFNVSIYDKQHKNSSSFEVKIPKENEYSYISVDEVEIVGQTMKLVTFNTKNSGNESSQNETQESHLYILDLDKKIVQDDRVIITEVSPDEKTVVNIARGYESDPLRPSRYVVYQMTQSKKETKNGSSNPYLLQKREVFVYDMESGKLEALQAAPIDEILQGTGELNIDLSGDELFLTARTDPKGPRVIGYSLTEKQVKKDLTIPLKVLLSSGEGSMSQIANNRLYMLVKTANHGPLTSTVAIADLNNGEIVYQGVIARKDDKALSNLLIENIKVN